MKLKLAFISALLFGILCARSQDYAQLSIHDQLLIAADAGDSAKVVALLRMGADTNYVDDNGLTPLMLSAQNGYTNIVKLLINKKNVNYLGGNDNGIIDFRRLNGYIALNLAIVNGYIETVEYLIRNGADVNIRDFSGNTPLLYAIGVDSLYLPDMLLYYDANVNLKNTLGQNALMIAAQEGFYELSVRLLEAGADITTTDENGNTALHYAVSDNHVNVMDLLIINGAPVDVKNKENYTPLALAVAKNYTKAAKLLIGSGADINTTVSKSVNPLLLAESNRNDSLVQILKNNQAQEIKRPNFNHFTFGSEFTFNSDDKRLGFTFGMSDNHFHFNTAVGYAFRPKAVTVLEQEDSVNYNQFWERRHFIFLSMQKAFFVRNFGRHFTTSAFVGINPTLVFGSYKGSNQKPDMIFFPEPELGCAFDIGDLRLKVSYKMLDLNLRYFNQEWFNFSLEFLINRRKGGKTLQ